MRTNSFDFERALKKMERLRKNNRSQEEIIDDLKSELATINELSLLTHAMRLIVELDCRKSSELYINVESPMKQALYLIDIYYSIADRDGIEDITEAKWDVISQLLDEMEMAYFKAVGFPNDGDVFHDERDEKPFPIQDEGGVNRGEVYRRFLLFHLLDCWRSVKILVFFHYL